MKASILGGPLVPRSRANDRSNFKIHLCKKFEIIGDVTDSFIHWIFIEHILGGRNGTNH